MVGVGLIVVNFVKCIIDIILNRVRGVCVFFTDFVCLRCRVVFVAVYIFAFLNVVAWVVV